MTMKLSLPAIAAMTAMTFLGACTTHVAESTTVKRTTVETVAPDPYAPPSPPAVQSQTTTTTTETYRAP